MNIPALTNKMQLEGYSKIYIWKAAPDELDERHVHTFDTKLIVLNGLITITIENNSNLLKPGDQIEILRNKIHSGLAGHAGCHYIVGERY